MSLKNVSSKHTIGQRVNKTGRRTIHYPTYWKKTKNIMSGIGNTVQNVNFFTYHLNKC